MVLIIKQLLSSQYKKNQEELVEHLDLLIELDTQRIEEK